MTCADVMTPNPSCCETRDPAVRAARIMRDEDVGSVPIVNNHSEKRLAGIVTDRDLAIQVIAAGHDANSRTVQEIMTSNPVTCRPDDDASEAMHAMSDHQVRRIPVVDDNGRLLGIIAQADLARRADEEDVGEMVEEISQEHGLVHRSFGRMGRSGGRSASSNAAGALLAGGIGLAVGATIMCLFDPSGGSARRQKVGGAARDVYNRSSDLISRAGQAVRKTREGEQQTENFGA